MNREIEFRAWLKSYKEIVKVDLLGKNKVLSSRTWFDFDDIELMQYTGLKDKNGTKIFEGDIVRFEVADICTKPFYIDYDKHDCSFSLFRKGIVDRGLMAHHQKVIVVIGNVYENKELLEDE